jgi:hypothetical protein
MFHVGQKVALVRDFGDAERQVAATYRFSLPSVGSVYTIRDIETTGQGTHIRLAEIVNPAIPYTTGWAEPNFLIERFRPVVDRPTDISIFKAMLNPKTAEIDA